MDVIKLYLHPRVMSVLLLGFASGLPLALTAGTLFIWLTEAGISKASVGLFASIATPYTLKFLWAPMMDGMRLPFFTHSFGRRRGWLIATQIALIAALIGLGFANPAIDPWSTAFFALLVAICSASQDIVFDAYRVEILPPEYQGAGAGAAVLGYRIGMIVSSAGALYAASAWGWQVSYVLMAALIGVGILVVLFSPEPDVEIKEKTESKNVVSWFDEYIGQPFVDFMKRPYWLSLLLFIFLYKFSDAFMGTMMGPFFIEMGFTKEQIANVVKLFGLWATIIGSMAGGALAFRIGVYRTLWVCGIAHMLTNFLLVIQASLGANIYFLALAISTENFTGGMGTAAFVAFMSGLCNTHFTATQYALLSSFASMGRTWFSTPAGRAAEILGWQGFFFFASLLAIPSLMLLWWLRKKITWEKAA